MDTKGGKLWWGGDGGVLNWAIGIDTYTVMCIKLMTDQKKKKTNYKKKKENACEHSGKGSYLCKHFKFQLF